ncbi:iron complex transport system permease protein [Amycolatopsis sulphurea]|uniref:Iron complex transport system permease protein n=1 Tax=Amycolatopsis sulphurea TaxID=76022 RepID=A0A2A9G1Q0_9PSEU|nr:iron ABC transporter permease [Amycolatopsis sulphurea]PFG56876.1 iron complex transport system permease protein [Amycolatopsis sulphurea]
MTVSLQSPEKPAAPARLRLGAPVVFTAGIVALVVLSTVHLLQGTSQIGVGELLRAILPGSGGDERAQAVAVLVASRLPRLAAALLVGLALGFSGCVLQSVARNPLTSPDTLAVNAGSYVTVVAVSAFGVSLPFYFNGSVAFLGGLAAAGLVLLVARGGGGSPARLVLAGSAIALALNALTSVLLMLFQQKTTGLFAWGSGTTVQSGLRQVSLAAPVIAVAVLGTLLLARRLDVLGLGDDQARVLGIDVARTRLVAVTLAVLLAAISVTVAGPIGFAGLCAPVIARLVADRVPGLGRHPLLLPLAGLAGALVVVTADVLLRALVPADLATAVPTGVVTSLAGGIVLVWLARRRLTGDAGAPSAHGTVRSGRWVAATGIVLAIAVAGAFVAALLLGDRLVLLGDVVNWWRGLSGTEVSFVLDLRWPRVLAALLGGAALAVAGAIVQAVARNPLAEPGLLGVTPGASVGAISVVLLVPGVGIWPVMGAATTAALLTFALVYRLAAGRRASSERLVLIGIGMSTAATAITTMIAVLGSPWNTNLALAWLSGSTYGRELGQIVPVALYLLLAVPLALSGSRTLDLLALDEDVPRVLGVPMERARLGLVTLAALLTAAAACAVGALGFVGLVAPHAARALVGSRHARVLPVAAALGAVLVSVADTLGRTVLAPSQVAAGLVTALIGAPYFGWLLWRSRALR